MNSTRPSTTMVYRFLDENEVVHRNQEEFVSWLWKGSSLGSRFVTATSLEEYMAEFAKRAFVADRHFIRSSDVASFVEDLVAVGYLTISNLN